MNLINDVNGTTKMIGIIGNPLENSILPMLYNTVAKMFGFNLAYIPFCVQEEMLAEAILGLRALNVLGFNITKPYNKEVMKYIDDNMRFSFLMGAINTVKNINGRFYGYNTIGEAFLRVAKENELCLKNKVITIFGTNEDARSIAVKLSNSKVSKINIIYKTTQSADSIKSAINDNIDEIVDVYTYKDKRFFNICRESDVLINTTFGEKLSSVDKNVLYNEKMFKKNQFVYDIINTLDNTFLLDAAKKSGCKIVNGVGMLVYQCILSYEIWTGCKFNKDDIRSIYDLLK